MEIKSKNDIIDYFASGIKQDELIGVENAPSFISSSNLLISSID
jgi:hypothetical protein